MNALKSLILLTSVLFLYETAQGQTPSVTAAPGDLQAWKELDLRYAKEKDCSDSKKAMEKALSDAKSACLKAGKVHDPKSTKRSGFDDCLTEAERCSALIAQAEPTAELDPSGNLLGIAGQLFGVSGLNFNSAEPLDPEEIKGACYGKKTFDEETKAIKTELKDVEDDISSIQKDIAKAKDDMTEEQEDARKALADLTEQARKEDQETAENERTQAADLMKAQAEAKAQVASLNVEVLQVQGQLANAIYDRTQKLMTYTDAMIKRKCIEQVEDRRSQTTSIKTGSQVGVIQQNGTRKKNEVQDFNNCIRGMQAAREATRQASQAQIDGFNAAIDAKQAQSRDLQKSLSLATSQQAQRSAEAASSKQQAQLERAYRSQNIQTAQQTKMTTANQRINELNQRLSEANQKKNEASSRLTLLGTTPAGEMSPAEAQDAFNKYESEFQNCESTCGSIDANACGDINVALRAKNGMNTIDGLSTGTGNASANTTAPVKAGAAPGAKGTDGK